jgi:hypothetical protein
LIAVSLSSLKTCEARAESAKDQAQAAADRLARLERGEDVQGGLGRPTIFDAAAVAAGFTEAVMRRMIRVHEIPASDFETVLLPRLQQASKRAERATKRCRDSSSPNSPP